MPCFLRLAAGYSEEMDSLELLGRRALEDTEDASAGPDGGRKTLVVAWVEVDIGEGGMQFPSALELDRRWKRGMLESARARRLGVRPAPWNKTKKTHRGH